MSAGFGRLTMEEPAPCHSFKSKQGGTQSRPPKPMADDSRGPQRQVVLSFDSWSFSGRFPASSGRFQHSRSAISRICGALKCWCGTPKCLAKRVKGSHRACLGSRMKIVAQSHTTEGLSRFVLSFPAFVLSQGACCKLWHFTRCLWIEGSFASWGGVGMLWQEEGIEIQVQPGQKCSEHKGIQMEWFGNVSRSCSCSPWSVHPVVWSIDVLYFFDSACINVEAVRKLYWAQQDAVRCHSCAVINVSYQAVY